MAVKRKGSGALRWIVKEAKRLRREHPRRFAAWKQYVAQASAMYKAKHKASAPARKVTGRKPAKYRQTGASNKTRDEQRHAAAPGKRVLNKGKRSEHAYYERRKNRSDVPGQLTGTSSYNYVVLQHLRTANASLKDAEARLMRLKGHARTPGLDRGDKANVKRAIKEQRKLIAQIKKDIRGYRTLLR